MKFKVLFYTFLVAVIISLSFVYTAQAPRPYRAFLITLPEVVEGTPGEDIIINGSILNFGQYWLHDFNLTVSGLPESHKVNLQPSYFEHLRILREWNPEQGVYLIPEKFTIVISVPADSAGIFTVNVTGQEHLSWRQLSNTTTFIFRVAAAEPPKLSISDIVVPETVKEFEPFNITFDVKNEGPIDQFANLSVTVPLGWTVAPAIKAITVRSGSSESVFFTITPTNTSGEISVLMLYPFKQTILNITKVGPVLVPKGPEVITVPTGLAALLEQLKALPTWVVIVALVFLVIIIWQLYKIFRTYRFRFVRKKPEEMKKLVEPLPAVNQSIENF